MLEELPSQDAATTTAAAATKAICNIRYRCIHPCCSAFSVKLRGYPAFQLKGITERMFLFKSKKSNTAPLRCAFSNRKDLAHGIRLLCQSYFACLVRADKLISKMPCVHIVPSSWNTAREVWRIKKGVKDESTAQDAVCLSFMLLCGACLATQAKLLAPIPTPSDRLSVSSSAFWLRPLRWPWCFSLSRSTEAQRRWTVIHLFAGPALKWNS